MSSQPKLDQILDDFYDGVFLTEQPKAKQAIKDLFEEIAQDSIGDDRDLVRVIREIEKL